MSSAVCAHLCARYMDIHRKSGDLFPTYRTLTISEGKEHQPALKTVADYTRFFVGFFVILTYQSCDHIQILVINALVSVISVDYKTSKLSRKLVNIS